MFKKFCLMALSISLSACSLSSKNNIITSSDSNAFNTEISEINISDSDSFRIGVLLPLTGNAARYGKGLKNATMLAMDDVNNPRLILQYYDTKSTPEGARIAIENALNQKSKLIIGPLMSSEVKAISGETIYKGVPIIAFSTMEEVLQPSVYTLGLLVSEQVERIISFAAKNNVKRLALLLPDNADGTAVAKAAVVSAKKNNVLLNVIGYYNPQNTEFSSVVKEMTNYKQRHQDLLKLRAELEAKAEAGNLSAQSELKKLETKEGIGDVGFDAVLIPESGAKLTAAISMFAYYDVAFPDVRFLGTSVWEAGNYNNESVMYRSWFPMISRNQSLYFANKYYRIFEEKPSSLYTFAYDAVALANEIANSGNDNINEVITNPVGYAGINGAFRFFANGNNQHSLDIVEIRAESNKILEAASQAFYADTEGYENSNILNGFENITPPQIYGKDPQTAQIAIYGKLLQ